VGFIAGSAVKNLRSTTIPAATREHCRITYVEDDRAEPNDAERQHDHHAPIHASPDGRESPPEPPLRSPPHDPDRDLHLRRRVRRRAPTIGRLLVRHPRQYPRFVASISPPPGVRTVDSPSLSADPDTRFPGESGEHRRERNRLLEAEIELRRALERVAAQRRALPPGGPVPDDYRFEQATGDGGEVRFSELFAPGKETLVIYSFMFPRYSGDTRPGPQSGETAQLPLADTPCASCTSILDALDGAAPHLARRVNLAVVAKADPERIRTFARERGWRNLRLLSSRNNTYNRDYLAESADGEQAPILNVFVRDGDVIRHSWATELMFAPRDEGEEARHVDLIWPIWNVLDMTPEGRGDERNFPGLDYQ
jgi:predicted dithiol-disulfide oxidoreductase (DUF899 family)